MGISESKHFAQKLKKFSFRSQDQELSFQPSCPSVTTRSSVSSRQESKSEGSDSSSDNIPSFKWLGNRQFSESAYLLPTDRKDMDRNIMEHYIFQVVLGGPILAPNKSYICDSIERSILNIGCGAGAWCMDVAAELKNVKIIGIDIVGIFPDTIRPPNCEFKLVDALSWPLPFDDNTFDLIHIETFSVVVQKPQYHPFLQELLRILKPGGYVQWSEYDWVIWDGGPVLTELMKDFNQLMELRSFDYHLPYHWISLFQKAGFVNQETRHLPIPIGAWGGGLGTAMAQNYLEAFEGIETLYTAVFGVSQEKFEAKKDAMNKEMDETRGYLNLHLLIASKPHLL